MMLTRDLVGKVVVTLDGFHVGKVEELEISEDWKVQNLVLRLTSDAAREIGIRLSFKPRGIVSTAHVKGVADYITIDVEKAQLKETVKPHK
ncbi:hypothetical protein MA03_07530 [Infirmifilum uzonense]|uniref:PRC-barrel domain-containing protein n=1 Tax=Infirmifilum uzonense TaxID=1550241 RepID=A0A0F7FJM2_9CREN|nr:PRC-barrel domain-containing protein [Infirmifilum uzonense]AKG39119.1 hypothetical protein MA03_07530 [Infirmifilum uzonense]